MRLRSKPEVAALAVLAYGPLLASSPGRVSADSKQDLYLDPGRFLSRAIHLWDPHVGAGTVPHQNLGYLFPTGPWYWSLDRLGVPVWVAQRLWLGTLAVVAVLGARWLFDRLGVGRVGATAGALVYLLTPYQLAFTARMSVLLLPWSALPWIVGLTMRVTRERGWRPAALLALVLFAAGGINASSLLLVGVAPLVWVVLEALRGSGAARRALLGAGRAAVLAIGVSLWWLAGVRLQGRYGLPVLQLTENVRTVALASAPGDILRGLGNWFFYGHDRTGWSVEQASSYAGGSDLVVLLSYAVPMLALGALFVLRWAHRTYFALLIVIGTVVAAGAWPPDDPRPYGSLWKTITTSTSLGLAFRNSPRAVPVVVLGMAGILAAAVGAVPVQRWRALGGSAAAGLAVLGLLPVWQTGFLTDSMTRPEHLPTYWTAAASALDAEPHDTRVLEIPGSSFAAYRWGTTVDPITPALIDRPYLAREVLPMGGRGTANLLAALDRRMQLGTFEGASLAPIARLFGVGTVVLRADLDRSGRFDTPPPETLWPALLSGSGLAAPRRFGPPGGGGADPSMPSVALFDVQNARPIVRAAPVSGPVVLAGDGDGIVDAAAAGLIDGRALVAESAALGDGQLAAALRAGAHLVVTDSNRRRAETWFYTLRDDRGETERPGVVAPDPTGYDFRLDPFPKATDDARTVVEQVGGTVRASMAGGPERPEDRAANAVDGDPTTAWRVSGPDPIGTHLDIAFEAPVPTSEVRLVQAPSPPGARRLARVRVQVDGGRPVDIDLGPSSLTDAGQAIPIAGRTVQDVRITMLATSPASPGGDDGAAIGLAEVRVGGAEIAEVVRPPVDLLRRVGAGLDGHSLDIVLTRLRVDVPGSGRGDDETHLDRRLDLPIARTFGLVGVARRRADAPSTVLGGGRCRRDLLLLDGRPFALRLVEAGDHLAVEPCAPMVLEAGSHRLTASLGTRTGVDLDRLTLSSDPAGAPAASGARGTPLREAGAKVAVGSQTATHLRLDVTTDGTPFWLVLAQSNSSGWQLDVAGARVGTRQLVDGYANGWLITPRQAGTLPVTIDWGPQGLVWAGIAASAVAVAVCLVILWCSRRRVLGDPALDARPSLELRRVESGGKGWASGAAWAVGTGLVGLVLAPPAVALAAAGVVVLGWSLPGGFAGPAAVAVGAPVVLLTSRMAHRPSWAWLVVIVVGIEVLRGRDVEHPQEVRGADESG